ncbi:MAG: MATE family efflux transporter [Rickettsiales bacterium]|nr:MATE family efflux transporter [Rickettsiales bacterium]
MGYKQFTSAIFDEIKESSKIAIPLIFAQIIFDLNGFFTTSMTAHLGSVELATYGLLWDIYLMFIAFFTGLFASTSILVSHNFGAKNFSNIGICFRQGLWVAILSTPILMTILWLCPIILAKTKQDPLVIKLITPAFHTLSLIVLPRNLTTIIKHFFMGINKAHLVTIMGIIVVPIQIFLTYLLLFGKLGFPKLGLNGIGYAVASSYYILLIPLIFYLSYSKQFKRYELFKNLLKIDLKIFYDLVRLGIPIGFTLITEIGLFAVIAIMMGKLGTETLVAYQISYQYLTLAFVVGIALLRTAAIRTGIEVGKNNKLALRSSALINLLIGVILMLVFSIIYIYFPNFVINLDINTKTSSSQTLVSETSNFLSMVGILIILDCIRLVSTGALRGLKDTKVPSIVILISFWIIAIPCAYLLGFTLQFGGIGIWIGIIIGSLFSIAILPFRFNLLSSRINLKTLVTINNK